MGITSLDIKNQIFTLPASIINILDFDSKKLSIQKKIKRRIYYDNKRFILNIDNLNGYFKKYNDNQYLTIIFTSED